VAQRLCLGLALLALLAASGCVRGYLYTHTVEPLNPNMHRTDVAAEGKTEGDVKHIAFRGISVAWNDNAIGDIARKNGLTVLYFADRETVSVLGIWRRETIHVYGR
jgi:hypothetical protein